MGEATVVSSSADISSLTIEWPSSPWIENNSSICEWEYQRSILIEEFSQKEMLYDLNWLRLALEKLKNLENNFSERVLKSKQRDDNRGVNVIPGYAMSHINAKNDPVIIEAKKKAKDTERIVESYLNKINS